MDLDQIIDNIGKLPELSKNALKEIISEAVSYTHLDVYKRQIYGW